MSALVWGRIEDRRYESGVHKGVLYSLTGEVTVWNGLISVEESEEGSEVEEVFFDGVKYHMERTPGFYQADVTAYGFPMQFRSALGEVSPRSGFTLTGQERTPFHFSYQTLVGESDYRIHVVYNAFAIPTQKGVSTEQNTPTPSNLKWKIAAIPPELETHRPSSHIVVESRLTEPSVLSDLENALYGTESTDPYLPDLSDLVAIYAA
jgi:hypothetical protein